MYVKQNMVPGHKGRRKRSNHSLRGNIGLVGVIEICTSMKSTSNKDTQKDKDINEKCNDREVLVNGNSVGIE